MKELTDASCIRSDVDAAKLTSLRKQAMSNNHILAISAFMKAIGNETRLRMLFVIWKSGELCVCDLSDVFGISQPAASRHLKILKEKALVETRRDAQTIFYRICLESPFAEMVTRMFSENELAEITLNLNVASSSFALK